MTKRDADRVAALERRAVHLEERLEKWDRGNPRRTREEAAALRWALRVITAADIRGLLDEVANRGPDPNQVGRELALAVSRLTLEELYALRDSSTEAWRLEVINACIDHRRGLEDGS